MDHLGASCHDAPRPESGSAESSPAVARAEGDAEQSPDEDRLESNCTVSSVCFPFGISELAVFWYAS